MPFWRQMFTILMIYASLPSQFTHFSRQFLRGWKAVSANLFAFWMYGVPDDSVEQISFSIRYCYIKRAKNKRIITVLQQILLCKYDQEKNHLNLTSSLLFLSFKSIKRHFASCFLFISRSLEVWDLLSICKICQHQWYCRFHLNKFDNLLTRANLFCCKEIWWKEVKLISSLMDLATKGNCVQSI